MTAPAQPISPPGPRHARRARIYLVAGAAVFALIVAGLILTRRESVPYTPGMEAAGSEEITSGLSRALPAGAPRVVFTDAAEEAGIRFTHFQARRSTQLPEDMGPGLAWGDYDDDGDPDLFLVNASGPLGPDGRPGQASPARSALYRNDGAGRFTDVTAETGVGTSGMGMGAAWGDHDGDGDLDLLVTRYGTNILFRNEGGGAFSDVTEDAGLSGAEGFWTGASWADFDRDGDLDLYVCGYVRYRYDETDARKTSFQYGAVLPYTLNPSSYPPERNLLYVNDGGRFRDIAAQAGVDNPTGRSLSAAWADFDGDGWPDLYVANDISDNAMYRNNGDGTFLDASHSAWVADYRGAMGLGVGDWENDGDLDIFVTHWIAQENAMYENLAEKMAATAQEPLHFIDQADMLGLGQIALDYIGWGTGFLDYDNDGRLDLFVANGSTFPVDGDPARLVPMRNLLFWNGGAEEGYFESGALAGPALSRVEVHRGSAFADYDGDGDIDIAVTANGGAARLLRNDAVRPGQWSRIVLRGAGASSRSPSGSRLRTTSHATGALLRITAGALTQTRVIGADPSYLGQSPPGEVHVGLGGAASIDRLEIRWPDGFVQSFDHLPAGAVIRIVEGEDPVIAPSVLP